MTSWDVLGVMDGTGCALCKEFDGLDCKRGYFYKFKMCPRLENALRKGLKKGLFMDKNGIMTTREYCENLLGRDRDWSAFPFWWVPSEGEPVGYPTLSAVWAARTDDEEEDYSEYFEEK